ncbi:cupin domain-containing protein [Hymenobacter sp. CRA2]|uniref:cupin domain-containing protein n=1 Tax=Hymenobacter sp. CRA2 TaxID=1955620 RepID=UPI00098EE4DA|nr:cupin domain-containing protein [Hymenobacter sp. CRA2]OON67756.1 cupin [Hymenobacter sp. CRA2]
MKRRQFVHKALSVSLGTLAYLPGEARQARGPGFKVPAGEGRYRGHIHVGGFNSNIIDVKISGKDTSGGFAVFEQLNRTPGKGTPMHVHPSQDEVFYILEGEFYFQVGSDKYALKTGDTIFLPRNVPHSWIQLSSAGRTMMTFQPAGQMEEMFVAFSNLKTPPTPEEAAQLFAGHGVRIVGPPVTRD